MYPDRDVFQSQAMQAENASRPDPDTIEGWLGQFFGAIDRMDASQFAGHFAPHGQFRFANQPPAQGPEAIAGGADWIFGMLDSIRHQTLKHWLADGDLLVEGTVHYLRAADQRSFSFPFLSVFEFGGETLGAIEQYRVFVDSHELFEPTVR